MLGLTLPSGHCGSHVQEQVIGGVHSDHPRVDQHETWLSLALHSRSNNVVHLHAMSHAVRIGYRIPTQHQLGRLQELIGRYVGRVEVQPESVVVHESMVDFTFYKDERGDGEKG